MSQGELAENELYQQVSGNWLLQSLGGRKYINLRKDANNAQHNYGIHSFKMGALPALYHADPKGAQHYNLIRHRITTLMRNELELKKPVVVSRPLEDMDRFNMGLGEGGGDTAGGAGAGTG